ncbi:MAG: hypothetical protein ACRD68_10555, partial [Pyrinomonadaceae bacterium]
MPERAGRIFCQRCLAANALGQELCERCGTRLMLVVEPSSLKYEDDAAASPSSAHDEHLLERVSALENKFARIAERLEQGLELLLRHARTSYANHALLETLIEALSETRAVDQKKLQKLWRERCARDAEDLERSGQRDVWRARVLRGAGGRDPVLFARLVEEGFAQLDGDAAARAVRTLERASALA